MTNLIRTLGLRDLTLLIIGAVIGSGIFLVPAEVLRASGGSISVSLLVWLAGGVLSLLGALTYGELSAMHPKAGGLYVYIRDCFGRLPAFLFGWTLFVAIAGGANATLAAAFSNYVGEFYALNDFTAILVRMAVLVVVTVVNVWGTRKSSDLQNWTTGIKVGAILLMSAILLWGGNGFTGASSALWPEQVDASLASGFGVAMISVLWAYEGWQYGTYSAGETINPQRNFPRAFLIGTAILIGVYMLANVAYLAALGPTEAASAPRIASSSVATVLGPSAAKMVAIAILISIFSAANSTALTAPRVYYAMARDGLFFKKLGEVHPRFHTPAFAIITGSIWSAILACIGTFQQLLSYVVFTGWIFYALAAACVFVYRKRMHGGMPPYQVPGYPWTPLLFILSAGALVGNTIIAKPGDAVKGLAMMLLGVPVYLFWRAKSREGGPPEEAVPAGELQE
ncbi:MAG TPA: amino acid permease [Blastocatellia bacterium]|jgi:APA family basic amino acid/polyamine antiporter|nr:amino acid permease [Blastocatellia bacterium]